MQNQDRIEQYILSQKSELRKISMMKFLAVCLIVLSIILVIVLFIILVKEKIGTVVLRMIILGVAGLMNMIIMSFYSKYVNSKYKNVIADYSRFTNDTIRMMSPELPEKTNLLTHSLFFMRKNTLMRAEYNQPDFDDEFVVTGLSLDGTEKKSEFFISEAVLTGGSGRYPKNYFKGLIINVPFHFKMGKEYLLSSAPSPNIVNDAFKNKFFQCIEGKVYGMSISDFPSAPVQESNIGFDVPQDIAQLAERVFDAMPKVEKKNLTMEVRSNYIAVYAHNHNDRFKADFFASVNSCQLRLDLTAVETYAEVGTIIQQYLIDNQNKR